MNFRKRTKLLVEHNNQSDKILVGCKYQSDIILVTSKKISHFCPTKFCPIRQGRDKFPLNMKTFLNRQFKFPAKFTFFFIRQNKFRQIALDFFPQKFLFLRFKVMRPKRSKIPTKRQLIVITQIKAVCIFFYSIFRSKNLKK